MLKSNKKTINALSRFLDLWIPQRMNLEHIPGLSIGVILGGKLIFQKAYGYADIEKKIKAKPETNYRIASISKMFTAIALLQLAEQGKLRLDDSLSLYLPWLKAKKGDRKAKDITIRQILSHTSGLWRDGKINAFVTDKFPKIQELQKEFSAEALTFPTLELFKYSNFAFALLSEVIRKASGKDYTEYINTYILKPLKMHSSATDLKKDIQNLATGYGRFIPGEKRERFSQVKTNAYASAAGVISNVQDLAKFLIFLISKEDARILGKISKKEMRRIQAATGDGGNRFYGLGIRITKEEGQRFFGHGGGFQGFATNVSVNQETGDGVVVLINSIDAWSGEIAIYIHSVLSRIKEELKTRKQVPNMRKYEGYYRNRWGDAIIVQAGSKLIARGPFDSLDEEITALVPVSKNKFRIEGIKNLDSIADSSGEYARFAKEKNKNILWWGASPFTRIKKSSS